LVSKHKERPHRAGRQNLLASKFPKTREYPEHASTK
jgi:hypothetical protein